MFSVILCIRYIYVNMMYKCAYDAYIGVLSAGGLRFSARRADHRRRAWRYGLRVEMCANITAAETEKREEHHDGVVAKLR